MANSWPSSVHVSSRERKNDVVIEHGLNENQNEEEEEEEEVSKT